MPVNIHGKEYITVNERLTAFRTDHPLYSIETEIVQVSDESVIIRAIIRDESGRILSTGLASEDRRSSKINSTNYIENCETSAVGRALAILGYGIENSIASADEVQSAIKKQESNLPSNKMNDLKAELQNLLGSKQVPDKMIDRIMEIESSNSMTIQKITEIIKALKSLPDLDDLEVT